MLLADAIEQWGRENRADLDTSEVHVLRRTWSTIRRTDAANLQVDDKKWMFLHGDKDVIYDLTDDYLQVGFEDPDAPGGFDHSGKLILTDKEGRIRSFSEGTNPKQTPKLIADIKRLLKEYEKPS